MSGPKAVQLRFSIPKEGHQKVHDAVKSANKAIADLDLYVMRHNRYGKRRIKQLRISPDAFIQMALQVANYRDTGRFALTCVHLCDLGCDFVCEPHLICGSASCSAVVPLQI